MPEILSPDKFIPGTQIVVERRIGQHQRKAMARVIGAHPPRYLLVDEPIFKERPLLDPEDENCIVRFLQDGRAFGFRAQIVSHAREPFPMLVLAYPQEFQEVSVRDEDRIGCGIPAKLTRPADAPELPPEELPKNPLLVTVLDLSTGGCQVAIPIIDIDHPTPEQEKREKPIPANHRADYTPARLQTMCVRDARLELDLELPPPWPARFEHVICDVRWIKNFRGYLLLGIRFAEYPAAFLENIRQLVEHQVKYFTQPL